MKQLLVLILITCSLYSKSQDVVFYNRNIEISFTEFKTKEGFREYMTFYVPDDTFKCKVTYVPKDNSIPFNCYNWKTKEYYKINYFHIYDKGWVFTKETKDGIHYKYFVFLD